LFFIPINPKGFKIFLDPFCDALHFGAFFVFTAGLRHYLLKHGSENLAATLSSAGFMSLAAVGIEILQPFFGRSASSNDVGYGLCGVFFAVSILWVFSKKPTPLIFIIGGGAALFMQIALLLPSAIALRALSISDMQFPQLADFEQPLELKLFDGSSYKPAPFVRVGGIATSGLHSLWVELSEDNNKLSFDARYKDWSERSNLFFEIHNPESTPFRLFLRIDDDQDCTEYENRYNSSFIVEQGWNRVEIALSDIASGPKNRKLNTSAIRKIIFFAKPELSPHSRANKRVVSFYLDNIRLK
jgi:hypothetical protein